MGERVHICTCVCVRNALNILSIRVCFFHWGGKKKHLMGGKKGRTSARSRGYFFILKALCFQIDKRKLNRHKSFGGLAAWMEQPGKRHAPIYL